MKLMRDAAKTGDAKSGDNKDDEKFEQTIKWWKIKDRLDLAKAQLSVARFIAERNAIRGRTRNQTSDLTVSRLAPHDSMCRLPPVQ